LVPVRAELADYYKEQHGTVYLTLRFMPKADLSHYQGREEAYVKHYLLEKYLPDWAYKVGRNGTPLYISMVSLGRGEPLIPIMRTLHLLGPLILYARVNWACKNEV
jgi:hypothetical protein